MKTKLYCTSRLLLLVLIVATTSCTRAGYQRMEEHSLPRYQQGVPVMSQFQNVCRASLFHEPGGFVVTDDWLWDVTKYPTYPENPPRWEERWCPPAKVFKITSPISTPPAVYHEVCKCPKIPIKQCSLQNIIKVPNTDPSKGAVNAWEIAGMQMDGLNWKSLVISFHAILVEGDKTPLGGHLYGRFNSADEFKGLKEKLIINGQEWEHWQQIPLVRQEDSGLQKKGSLSGATELYKTKIGNYTLFVSGGFPPEITNNPDWLAKRQAFLRQWVETFKIEPLPADYKKVQ